MLLSVLSSLAPQCNLSSRTYHTFSPSFLCLHCSLLASLTIHQSLSSSISTQHRLYYSPHPQDPALLSIISSVCMPLHLTQAIKFYLSPSAVTDHKLTCVLHHSKSSSSSSQSLLRPSTFPSVSYSLSLSQISNNH